MTDLTPESRELLAQFAGIGIDISKGDLEGHLAAIEAAARAPLEAALQNLRDAVVAAKIQTRSPANLTDWGDVNVRLDQAEALLADSPTTDARHATRGALARLDATEKEPHG